MSEIKIIELTFFIIVLLILVIFLYTEIELSISDKVNIKLKLGREESFNYRKLRKKIEEERQERLAQNMRLEQLIESSYINMVWRLNKLDLKTTLLSKKNIECIGRISWDEAIKSAYKKVELGNGKVIEIMPIAEDTEDKEEEKISMENLELVKEDRHEYGTIEYYKIPRLN